MAWRIARDQGWESTFDGEYLAVAQLQADALVTVDPAMEEPARCIHRGPRIAPRPPDTSRVGPG